MVSLSGEHLQGGYFFRQEEENTPELTSPSSQDQMLAHDSASLGLIQLTTFHPLRTGWIAFLQLLLFIAYESLMFVFTNGMKVAWLGGTDPPFSFLALLHVALWLVIFLMDRILQQFHHKSQAWGYLEFFRETKELRRLPYSVLSLGNAVLLILFAVMGHSSRRSNRDPSSLRLSNILQILFTIEFVICVPGILWYLALIFLPVNEAVSFVSTVTVKVARFNRRKPLPDAEDTEVVNGCLTNGVAGTLSLTGYRDVDYLDEVLEKQADMIRYLQQHNANLGRRLMELAAQRNTREYCTSS